MTNAEIVTEMRALTREIRALTRACAKETQRLARLAAAL
jgi:hypothetical protein